MKEDVSVWPSSNRGFGPGAPEFRGWRVSSPPWLEYPSWIANRPQPVQDGRRDGVGECQPYVRQESVTGNAINPDADKDPRPRSGRRRQDTNSEGTGLVSGNATVFVFSSRAT